ncbi:MAG: LysR family transcriptional regulator [Bradyrhizobiaceae bacterium]|nr:MAG: LysR family transcriptional regulator [Bradyrhizobiaceae bacterium]
MDRDTSMRVFVRAVERGSFSAAARDFGHTPSAVSKLVTRLEDRLGVRLIRRTTRRLALTPEGEIYFARARAILNDIEEAEAEVTRARGAPRGRLRINSGTAFGLHQLTPALPDFLARYPEIDIDLSITDRIVDLMEESADIAVRSGPIGNVPHIVRKIADLERVICAAPAYLARRGTPRSPADLARHDCIVISAQTGLNRWPFRTRAGVDVFEVRPRASTDDVEAAVRLATEGAGIVRLADVVVGGPIRRGELVPILADVNYVEPLPLSAVYAAGRHRLPKVRVFLEFVIARFSHAPWRFEPGGPKAS